MRKLALLFTLAVATAGTALAEERHQSYIAYDDGGTIVRSGEDGREIEAHRNLPIYPGDEVVTARRGRTEIRLSDGNIIGIDRTTALRFSSIIDSYEGDADETVVELRHGKVGIYRTDIGRQYVRLDTDSASYIAHRQAIYSVETDSRGRDRVTVFEGSVEVRTPSRATRLREGEAAEVDARGLYDLVGDNRHSADDFERWFLERADRFNGYDGRYMDRRLSYWADDLDEHGRWVMVSGIGWSWRPYVSVGWRPYYNGYWYRGRHGSLTWVSHDPWGWGTYHYGRWAHDPMFGWIWVPGHGYSPAWVYWMFGSSYVGWAPAGWWDCYRPYYGWAYDRHRSHFGFGFGGRIRVSEVDLRPWTFVDSGTLVSNRIDRAALTTDAVKQRLGRNGGIAGVSGDPVRFTRDEMRDPADAIRRRGLDGRDTGRESGAPPTDLTPFFRRDENPGGAIRDRVVRARGGSGTEVTVTPGLTSRSGGGLAPIGGGGVAPIGRGSVAPIDRGSVAPVDGSPSTGGSVTSRRNGSGGGAVDRGSSQPATPADSTRSRDAGSRQPVDRPAETWRGRVGGGRDRGTGTAPPAETAAPPSRSRETPVQAPRGNWRSRVRADADGEAPRTVAPRAEGSASSSSDVPRRVIDRIGGARITPRESTREPESGRSSGRSSGTRIRPVAPRNDSGSSARSSDSGSSRRSDSGGSSARSSSGSGSKSSGSSGSGRSSGGRIKRD